MKRCCRYAAFLSSWFQILTALNRIQFVPFFGGFRFFHFLFGLFCGTVGKPTDNNFYVVSVVAGRPTFISFHLAIREENAKKYFDDCLSFSESMRMRRPKLSMRAGIIIHDHETIIYSR